MLPEDLIPDGSGNPLTKCESFLNVKVPEVRRRRPARNRHDGHIRRQLLVLPALLLARLLHGHGRQARRLLDADGPVHRRHQHAVLHLLYARFWTKVMRDLGLVKYDEPFKNLFTQGMLMADCYYRNGDDGRKGLVLPGRG